jgi:hypothetical protein
MRSMRLWPAAVVLGLVACGGSESGGGDATATGVTVEELPAAYAKAICDVFTGCVGDLWTFFRPGEDCVEQFTVTAGEQLASLPAAIDAGRVKYHPDQIAQCLDEVRARGCSGFSDREPKSCQAAIEGTVADGGDCELDSECSGDRYCKVGSSCPGKCAAY